MLNRTIRDTMAGQQFVNASGARNFTQLDRWNKLADFVKKLDSRHGWKVAAEFMIEFLDLHDYELIHNPDTGIDIYTVHLPDLLDQILDDFAVPERDFKDKVAPKGSRGASDTKTDWTFHGRCLVCFEKGCSAKTDL